MPVLATRCRPAPIYPRKGKQEGVVRTEKREKAAHDYRKLHLPLGVCFLHIVLKRSVTRCKRR